mgnify:CR=1 FL=1
MVVHSTNDRYAPDPALDYRQLEGYLLKQGEKGVIKTWKRRFFMLDGKKLRYFEESKEKGFIDLELAVSIHGVPTQSKEKQAEDSGVDFQEWDLQVVTPTRTYNLRAPKYVASQAAEALRNPRIERPTTLISRLAIAGSPSLGLTPSIVPTRCGTGSRASRALVWASRQNRS